MQHPGTKGLKNKKSIFKTTCPKSCGHFCWDIHIFRRKYPKKSMQKKIFTRHLLNCVRSDWNIPRSNYVISNRGLCFLGYLRTWFPGDQISCGVHIVQRVVKTFCILPVIGINGVTTQGERFLNATSSNIFDAINHVWFWNFSLIWIRTVQISFFVSFFSLGTVKNSNAQEL